MCDEEQFKDTDKVNILFKRYLGYPNTHSKKPYYNEVSFIPNDYLLGENVLLSDIPKNPNFINNKSPSSVNLNHNDFYSLTDAILEDDLGLIRKYEKLKLQPVPGSKGKSFFKLNNNNINVLRDTIRHNKHKENGHMPYLYSLYLHDGTNLPAGMCSANWFFDVKNGVINFVCLNNVNFTIDDDHPIYLTFYKYIGEKGISKLKEENTLLKNKIDLLETTIINLSSRLDNAGL